MSVTLVGAGPGDPGLITVRGLERLRACDAVVYDRLVSEELVDEAPADALRICRDGLTQEQVDRLLVELGRDLDVVRLKGGDPFVFGRGSEELEVLRDAGIDYDVVPGISSIAAVPAAAWIPVTHRGLSDRVTIATAHAADGSEPDYDALAATGGTLVLFMGLARLPALAAGLIAAGLPAETPAAVVSRGTLPDQEVVTGSLAELPAVAADLPGPALVVVGEVVGARRVTRSARGAQRVELGTMAHSTAVEPLRADVHLLGDLLGQVLVEQEGDAFLALEERIRALARGARTGGDHGELDEAVAGLDVATKDRVLAAFSLFFQLANIAEQHHRVRRLRDYEREGAVARESIADAVELLGAAGVTGDELADAARRLHVEPVLTAHPTEATRRTVLAAHQRIARRLRALDDPWLTPLRRERVVAGLHAEITALWQTDPVRTTRPRVVDEIRAGLWFFETSLWQAVPAVVRALRHEIPDAPAPLRFGTWIGGDMDGNPSTGAETVREAVERARELARELLMRDVRALAVAWGMSTEVAGPVPELGTDADEPYRAFLTGIWERLRADGYRTGDELAADLERHRRGPPGAPRGSDRRRRAGRPAHARRGLRPPPRVARPSRACRRGPRPRTAARPGPRGGRLGAVALR